MEKRFLTAVILSFLVLFLWGKTMPKQVDILQEIDESEITSDVVKTQEIPLIDLKQINSIEDVDIEGVTEILLENDKLELSVSSFGADISNVVLKEYGRELPISAVVGLEGFQNVVFQVEKKGPGHAIFWHKEDGKRVSKEIILSQDSYDVEIRVLNTFGQKNEIKFLTLNMSKKDEEEENVQKGRDKHLFEYAIKGREEIKRKAKAFSFDEKENTKTKVALEWAAFRDRYFCAIVKPLYQTGGYQVSVDAEEVLSISSHEEEGFDGSDLSFSVFFGPERKDVLESYGHGFEEIKRYYNFGPLNFVASIINTVLNLLHKGISNWGVCILLISCIIYFSMYPLTSKGLKSMKKMQSIAPLVSELKAKYKDNPKKMNEEVMLLYRKNGVNPIGGCLPMLLQMPVFIGLYQVLLRNVSFKGAGFLWIKDLTEPDSLFTLPFQIPYFGNEFNLLPVIMGVLMGVQQKFSSKNMATMDQAQREQQKMMGRIMPLMMGVLFYKMSSGLTLYFTMFYLFSALSQWKMSNEVEG